MDYANDGVAINNDITLLLYQILFQITILYWIRFGKRLSSKQLRRAND